MPNKAFLRAASLLCHPLSIAAMLALLFNDHWLRWYTPSWWTGKLGDFAWLFFAPFAAAMILAVLIPPSPRQEKIVPAIAFGLTGGIFALAKTAPFVHALVAQIAETLLGLPIGLRRDPSDLIALASLGAAGWLWERHATTARAAIAPGLIALLLAVTLTLANGPMPDYGITEFQLSGDTVIARSTLGAWKSTDGGLTWEQMNAQEVKSPGLFATTWGVQRSAIVTDTLNANVFYRVAPEAAIERSDDGSKTWRVDFAITPLSEAARAYADRHQRYGFTPGPVNGIVDPKSGNAIFAMAHEGALVRKPSGEYVWVSVGHYQRIVFNDPLSILGSELLLALGLGLLIVATQMTRASAVQHWSKYLLPALAALAWIADSVLFPPGRANGQYGVAIAQMAAVGMIAFISIITLVILLLGRLRAIKSAGRAGLVALGAMPLYFAPYYLWALNLIPNYIAAQVIAFALGAVMVIVGLRMSVQKVEK